MTNANKLSGFRADHACALIAHDEPECPIAVPALKPMLTCQNQPIA